MTARWSAWMNWLLLAGWIVGTVTAWATLRQMGVMP